MELPAIYLDHSATTPLHPEVVDTMQPFMREYFGNAGSLHRFGRRARKAVDDARDQVAALIRAEPRDIYFTSGGTEADNLAIRGAATARADRPGGIVVSAIEHHAVLHPAEYLARRAGADLYIVPVDAQGRVNPEAVAASLNDSTAIVSIMHANNETGVIQPIEAIGALCRERGVCFHTDAVQTAGKLPLDVRSMPVDMVSLSAHKINGPKGVGALYAAKDAVFEPQALGGAQERGRRAGTENVAGIVGFGKACEIALRELETYTAHLMALRKQIERGILERIPDTMINGAEAGRLPHIANMRFEGVEAESILLGLDMEGIAVSTGSACTSGAIDPSHVLTAMGQRHEEALAAVRFSLGRGNSAVEVDRVLGILPELVARLRAAAPLSPHH